MTLPAQKFLLQRPLGLRLGGSTTSGNLWGRQTPLGCKSPRGIEKAGEPSTVWGFPQRPCLGWAVAPCKPPRSTI